MLEKPLVSFKYSPGYDWIPGHFGPPPGIPVAKKRELDGMDDKEYLYAFLRLSKEQKKSLMISEAERRRTFNAHWPIQHVVTGNDLAIEGFYYTGIAHKVQCAFCNGIISNWEKGDVPAEAHKANYSYCRMVRKKICFNIPYGMEDCYQLPVIEELYLKTKANTLNEKELSDDTFKPVNMKYASLQTRLETFRSYSYNSPVSAFDLASAGFYLIGSPDIVKCFCCDGELLKWAAGDDCWVEHAKWYPGCYFLRENKGTSFVKQARSSMTEENREISNGLMYNSFDLSFLASDKTDSDQDAVAEDALLKKSMEISTKKQEDKADVENLNKYKTVVKLGMDSKLVRRAYELNGDMDFADIQDLITLVQVLEETDECSVVEKANFDITSNEVDSYQDDGIEQSSLKTTTDFTNGKKERKFDVKNLMKYKMVANLVMDSELVRRAYGLNKDMDFADIQDLISLVIALEEEDYHSIEHISKLLETTREHSTVDSDTKIGSSESNIQPSERDIDITDLIRQRDLSEEESQILVEALMCYLCKENPVGAALLPCGHFCMCESCSLRELPGNCPECCSIVRAAVRAYLSYGISYQE